MALVVLLAGCGGAAVSEDGGDGAAGGSDGSDGDSASGSGGDAGSSGSGDDSADQSFAVTDSEQALRDAGSFTATWTFTMTDANGTEATMSSAYVVDLDTERSHESFSIDGEAEAVEFETFYADGMAYTSSETGSSRSSRFDRTTPTWSRTHSPGQSPATTSSTTPSSPAPSRSTATRSIASSTPTRRSGSSTAPGRSARSRTSPSPTSPSSSSSTRTDWPAPPSGR
ncbi:hypothetical protein ACFQH8_07640 [Halomicroarcula sp. GCM10025710]